MFMSVLQALNNLTEILLPSKGFPIIADIRELVSEESIENLTYFENRII